MKEFEELVKETLQSENLEELEAAADLFQFGIERGYYNKRQCDEFNETYWKVKNRCLAYEIADLVKGSALDILGMVKSAPSEIKNDKGKLIEYVNGRIKALKGSMKGIK